MPYTDTSCNRVLLYLHYGKTLIMMKIIPLLLIFLFQGIYAQKHITDSLERIILRKVYDTFTVNALNELAWEYRKTNPKKALKYAFDAHQLSNTLLYSKGIVTSLNRTGTVYIYQKRYNQAENIYLKILNLEKKRQDRYGIARAQNQLCEIYRNKKEYSKSLNHGLSALQIFEDLKKLPVAALVANNVGLVYQNQGSYSKAMEYMTKSIKIRESLNDQKNLSFNYLNLGVLLLSMKNYESAKKYFRLSETLFSKEGDEYELAKIYNNLGNIYLETKQEDSAAFYYNKAFVLKAKTGIAGHDPNIYNNLGKLSSSEKKMDQAFVNYRKSMAIQSNFVDQDKIKESTVNLGNLYYQSGQYDKAIQYYKTALSSSKSSGQQTETLNALNNLYLCYSSKKQYDSAYYYGKQYNEIRDSLDDDVKKAFDVKQLYDQEKKKNELLAKDKKIAQGNIEKLTLKNQKKNILLYSLSIGFFMCILLFFAFFKWKSEKQKALIAQKEKQIEQQKMEELLQQQELKSIHDMIRGQEEERKRIARDLHDRLGSMLSVAKVYYKSAEEQIHKNEPLDISQYQKANELLDEACQEVRKISYDLSSGVLTKFGLVAAVEDLKVLIEQTKQMNVEFISHGIDDRLENEIEIGVYRIIQELLSNVLKYSQADNVTIQILRHSEGLNTTVEDDGIGFNPKTKHTGMGLHNIQSRVDSLGGTLAIDSSPGNGTSVNIEIPISTEI